MGMLPSLFVEWIHSFPIKVVQSFIEMRSVTDFVVVVVAVDVTRIPYIFVEYWYILFLARSKMLLPGLNLV